METTSEYHNKILSLINDLANISYKFSNGEIKFIILQNGLRQRGNNVGDIGFYNMNEQLNQLRNILGGQPTEWNNNIYNKIKNYYLRIDIELSIRETESIKKILYVGYLHKSYFSAPTPKRISICWEELRYYWEPKSNLENFAGGFVDWLLKVCDLQEIYDYVNHIRKKLNELNIELIKNEEEHMSRIDKIEEEYIEKERLRNESFNKAREEQLKREKEEKEEREKEEKEKEKEEKEKEEKREEKRQKEEKEFLKELFKSSGAKYIHKHEYLARTKNYYRTVINRKRKELGELLDFAEEKFVSQVSCINEMMNHPKYNIERILKIEKSIILKNYENEYYQNELHILSKYESKIDELRKKYRDIYLQKRMPRNPGASYVIFRRNIICEFECSVITKFIMKYYNNNEAFNCFLKAYHYIKMYESCFD